MDSYRRRFGLGMGFTIRYVNSTIRPVGEFSSAIYISLLFLVVWGKIPNATAQLTLLLPMKYFSHTTTLANIELRSRITPCCCSIFSTHFRRETQVGAYNVILYPRRPKCVNVIAYPLFAGSLLRPGRFNPIVVVLAGGNNNPEDGRFANPLLETSSDWATINNSNGMGYISHPFFRESTFRYIRYVSRLL